MNDLPGPFYNSSDEYIAEVIQVEANMICKCKADMEIKGDRWVCPVCQRQVQIIRKVPPQAELWVEVQKLRAENKLLQERLREEEK